MYGPDVSFQLSAVPPIEPLEAQLLFNQGIMQEFNFNHVESRRNFEHVVKLNPRCALCWWGVARSYSSNINHDIENFTFFNEVAARALEELRPADGEKVSMLVKSIQKLRVPGATTPTGTKAEVNKSRHDLAQALCVTPTKDADVSALCADALMASSAWDYYDGPELKPFMKPAWVALRHGVSPNRSPHPLALHLFIHLAEPSKDQLDNPLLGQLAADALDGMVPGAGHLNHMVAHIYQQVGRYAAGVEGSRRAQRDNDAYLKNCLSPYGMGHNLHVGIFNAVHAARRGDAVAFAERQIAAADDYAHVNASDLSEPQSRVSPFSANLALTNLRFGFWAEAVDAAGHEGPCGDRCRAMPDYQNTTLDYEANRVLKQMVLGFANEAASKSSDSESAAVGLPPLKAPVRSFGTFEENLDRRPQMAIVAAQYELAARRAYTRGDVAKALAALRDLSSILVVQPYMEPDAWYYDPRECIGYILLTRGEHGTPDPKAALEQYLAALRHKPRSPWALIGAAQASAALSPAPATAANPYRLQFQAAMKEADVEISSSCPQFALKAPLV
jgi:hypothetical protein